MTEGSAPAPRVSFSKPHPFSLLQVARIIGGEHARCAYVGDTLDDIRAANAAKREMNFVSIGCLATAEDKDRMRREFERAGADVIIEHPDELVIRLTRECHFDERSEEKSSPKTEISRSARNDSA